MSDTPLMYSLIAEHPDRPNALRVTPAMQAGVADHVWSLEEIAALADAK